MSRLLALLCCAALLGLQPSQARADGPLAGSRCAPGAVVDPLVDPVVDADFRDQALTMLEGLVVHAPGQPADGAIRIDHGAGLHDAAGHPWFRIAAYQVNLGMIGALATGPRALSIAADWLRWQERHIPSTGPARGVVLDTWLRADTHEESTCPDRVARATCDEVDAYDSTAASTLLMADAYLRAGGDMQLIREPSMRRALDAAAAALAGLGDGTGFTIAKPSHPVVYTMDQVEVAAGWRAWARLQDTVYAQPASAANSLATATALERAVRERLVRRGVWTVSLDSGAPQTGRWYPDTVAQAWPLLWLPEDASQPDAARARWTTAIAGWQGKGRRDWTAANVDPDGFWWPAVAVAALCTGDRAAARRWTERARHRLIETAPTFARPFQVGDLLWLMWMADPRRAAVARAP